MNKIIQWNIRGARVNYCELLLLITKYCPAIICPQETHLKNTTTINMKNYYSYNYIKQYTDRPCDRSSIIINKNIPHSEITLNTNMQAVAISATLHKTITVCSVYIPPNKEPKQLELNKLIEQLPRPFVIMGDFNSHNEIWGSKKTDKKGKVIESLLNQDQLCMYNNKSNTYLHPATGTYSAIDLSIWDLSLFLDCNWKVHDDTCGSDNFPILLENTTDELSQRTPSWNRGKANWDGFKTSCLAQLTSEANKNNEEYILYFTNTLLNIAEEHIPKSSTSTKYNEQCKKAVRLRKATFRKFRINPTWENLNIYKNSRAKARKIIENSKRNTRRNYVAKITSNTKPKKVWQRIWKITGQNNNTLTHNNLKITDEKDIANHLAETFSQNSSTKKQSKSFQIIKTKAEKVKIKFQSKNTESYNQPFSVAELKESLNKSHNTAVRPDKIHYQFLKELPEPSTNFLLQIFNNLWNSGDIPKIWKETRIIPIPKPFKDNTNAKNYRPIILSSCVCKTLERMLNAILIWYLETNELITEYQSSFRSQRSPMDHLIRLETFIREASIKKEHRVAVFFDLKKAYDTTWKCSIVKDLKNLGLEGRMPISIQNFLQDRRFRVRMGEVFSEEKQEMNVPQGSVLSVTLFNIKINNIVKNINSGTNCALYVDDFLICYRARNMNHIERQLQICLDKLHK